MLKDLKVVFMGTPEFSVKVLEDLIMNTNVILVVTQPDKEIGRHHEISYSEVKETALSNKIPVFQPINIKTEYDKILELKPDIIITCAYGQIIPNAILSCPKYGCINVHASLLPKLRGGAPIQHAILDGYEETGITIMYMDEGMDTGDIISSEKIKIEEDDTYQTLHDKLSILGSKLLIKTLPSIIKGENKRIKQNTNEVTYGYNIERRDELIDFNKDIKTIYNKVRGLNPIPSAYFNLNDKVVKVYGCEKIDDQSFQDKLNGEIVKLDKKGIYIKAIDGLIKITELQISGKKRMDTSSFLNGNKEELLGVVVNGGYNGKEGR